MECSTPHLRLKLRIWLVINDKDSSKPNHFTNGSERGRPDGDDNAFWLKDDVSATTEIGKPVRNRPFTWMKYDSAQNLK